MPSFVDLADTNKKQPQAVILNREGAQFLNQFGCDVKRGERLPIEKTYQDPEGKTYCLLRVSEYESVLVSGEDNLFRDNQADLSKEGSLKRLILGRERM